LVVVIGSLVRVVIAAPASDLPSGSAGSGMKTNAVAWGQNGGLQFALHPNGFSGKEGGPRGLIRIGYPTLPGGGYDLINFIAVEPIVNGKRGYSELEKSSVDGKSGKIFRVIEGEEGRQEAGPTGVRVGISVERFENGAHVRLIVTQRSDEPDELAITVEAEPDSAPIEMCILTATMGNKARARLLTLKDGPISSLQLWPDYREGDFSPSRVFGFDRLPRTGAGDVVVAILNDEENPAEARPFGKPHFWDYKGVKVTQYWRKRAGESKGDIACAVNGRFVYWGSKQPIPGGIAFENFELREPFRSGQTFVFGITRSLSGVME